GIRCRNVTGVQTCALPICAEEAIDAAGAEGASTAAAVPTGLPGEAAGAGESGFAIDSGARIDGGPGGEEEGGSFLDRLLALLGTAVTPASVTGAQMGAAAGSEAIGQASIG